MTLRETLDLSQYTNIKWLLEAYGNAAYENTQRPINSYEDNNRRDNGFSAMVELRKTEVALNTAGPETLDCIERIFQDDIARGHNLRLDAFRSLSWLARADLHTVQAIKTLLDVVSEQGLRNDVFHHLAEFVRAEPEAIMELSVSPHVLDVITNRWSGGGISVYLKSSSERIQQHNCPEPSASVDGFITRMPDRQ